MMDTPEIRNHMEVDSDDGGLMEPERYDPEYEEVVRPHAGTGGSSKMKSRPSQQPQVPPVR